jgi:cytochrome c peroxidase
MKLRWTLAALGVGGSLLLAAALLYLPRGTQQAAPMLRRVLSGAAEAQAITPLPQSVALDERKVALGRQLFHDTRLSRDNSVACASCHVLSIGGVDRQPVSTGIGGRKGVMNAPTVYNVAYNYRQFWDGRSLSLEEQIDGPLHNPDEMDTNWSDVLAKLAADTPLRQEFEALYHEGLSAANLRDALATFERALVTPDAPFDRYLRGDLQALSVEAKEGWRLFRELGCVSCHQGVNVGGNLYEKLGLVEDFYGPRGAARPSDLGRFNLTRDAEHRFEFRVPPLRNVALTAPYLHDGSVATLEAVVLIMARYQLGVRLKPPEVVQLVAFLNALTGIPAAAAGVSAAPMLRAP